MPSSNAPHSISSPQNPHFRRWIHLLDSRGIKKFHQFIVFGEKVVRETLESLATFPLELVFPKSQPLSFSPPTQITQYALGKSLFAQLDIFGTHFPLVICQTPSLPLIDLKESPQGLEVLCPLSDPSNVGALIRSCLAFGIHKVILLQEASLPFHPKAVRASSGAILSQPLFQGPSLDGVIQQSDSKSLVSLDMEGQPLETFTWPKNLRLLVGQEGSGLPGPLSGRSLAISMRESANSLNAVVATSIALYGYRLQYPLSYKRGT